MPTTSVGRGSGGQVTVVGPVIPYVAGLLHDWGQKGSANQDKLDWVSAGLNRLGLSWKVRSKLVTAAQFELSVGRLAEPQKGGANDLVDLADVGFGVSQVLPVLVALAAASPGQLVLIEQPELHLHPRAQWALGALLAEAALASVVVVVETHSHLLLQAIQTVVARKKLSPELVGLHWFSRDAETGLSQVRLAELGEDGSFGDWPVDFAGVEADADDAYLDAALGTDGDLS
jgi:hypothetical protein